MKNKLISPVYKILLLYEDIKNAEANVTEDDYLKYLDRLYVRFLGIEAGEICETIKGLHTLGASASHSTVKSNVFHLIDLIERGAI